MVPSKILPAAASLSLVHHRRNSETCRLARCSLQVTNESSSITWHLHGDRAFGNYTPIEPQLTFPTPFIYIKEGLLRQTRPD